jgi:hypothetical protein
MKIQKRDWKPKDMMKRAKERLKSTNVRTPLVCHSFPHRTTGLKLVCTCHTAKLLPYRTASITPKRSLLQAWKKLVVLAREMLGGIVTCDLTTMEKWSQTLFLFESRCSLFIG